MLFSLLAVVADPSLQMLYFMAIVFGGSAGLIIVYHLRSLKTVLLAISCASIPLVMALTSGNQEIYKTTLQMWLISLGFGCLAASLHKFLRSTRRAIAANSKSNEEAVS